MIAVTFALRSESSEFLRRLEEGTATRADVVTGKIVGKEVFVLHTGVGGKTARLKMTEFLGTHTPTALISSGFAGALTNKLEPGDLLLADNFSDPHLAAAARTALSAFCVKTDRLSTASAVIHSNEDRIGQTAADDAAAVDMETQFIGEACAARAVRMVSLRVISDSPAAPFPAPPEILFDVERQRTNYRALLLHIAKHPRVIGRLQTFGRQIADARRVLADALCCLISDGAFNGQP